MRPTAFVAASLSVAFVASAFGATAARAQQREVIERVAATVNDEAIFLSDLRRRAIPFLPQAMQAPTEMERMAALEQLYSQLLDALVDEELIQQSARDMQVRVTNSDVDRAIDNVRSQSQLSEDEFWQAVRAQGFTESQYRGDVRRQLLRLKVLNTRARGRVNITETDVEGRYRQMVREQDAGACFEVQMIVVPFPENASATQIADARSSAEELYEEVTPQTFADNGGRDLGRVCEGDLQPALMEALSGKDPGDITEPERIGNGFVMLHVVSRAAGNVPPYAQIRQQLFQQMMQEAMQRQERIFLDELKREAVIDRRL
jgi:peptidyl-prolyl cis-trans isomerase SurA